MGTDWWVRIADLDDEFTYHINKLAYFFLEIGKPAWDNIGGKI